MISWITYVLEEVNKEDTFLTERVAVDLVFVLLFATYETTSAGITLVTKFLSDNAAVLEELTFVSLAGYTVPAGWVVMVCPSTLHLNPDKYEDPLAFNPWRWEGQEMHSASKDFMAFGGNVRLCVGADFAKLQMAIYLHYLVAKYR
ncbi:hypothetical protein RJ639_033242 [Escallonia herrerae]|uniref:Cytochrome P450 n=1 Tax=Escallonia herrerae TaxID=1293975 RepID=A0AA88WXP4_9ASTE|nr:hypothetical protein RJ639_033242 [Escallonia herrerae]